jgi:hypothetical protein
MPEAVRKYTRRKSAVANARAIRGAVGECLRLSDELSDHELKGDAMRFVHAMDFLVSRLLGEERRAQRRRLAEKEVVARLRDELAHISQLLTDNERIAEDLGDTEAKKLLLESVNIFNLFTMSIDRKHR